MEIDIRFGCLNIDWKTVSETLKLVKMAYYEPDIHQKAFKNSYVTVFVYHDNHLIGFGRAISDGAYQAAVYDIAVVPEFQRKGIGTKIVKNILSKLSQCNVILYASPGKEEFYETLGLRKMKTGMALFKNAQRMKEKGFTE
ncbi:GNAT family N-acetyltransferase [Desulfobacterium sp. N47]|uniref:N-acetyltransferase domain-containing protein n=1 Tax=uncultured Desulfobacterium sp. TaxID=201089 RepID=E1YKZ5_9BACT|nr:hypothetical protein N47_E42900 [uncultured Desulfobacterium sp.]